MALKESVLRKVLRIEVLFCVLDCYPVLTDAQKTQYLRTIRDILTLCGKQGALLGTWRPQVQVLSLRFKQKPLDIRFLLFSFSRDTFENLCVPQNVLKNPFPQLFRLFKNCRSLLTLSLLNVNIVL